MWNRTIYLFLTGYFLLSLYQPVFAEERLPVKTIALEKKTVPLSITAFGVLETEPQLLYFERSGYLSELLVDEGAQVNKNQLLAKLDTILIDNQQAQAKLALDYAQKKLTRARQLKRRKILSQDQLEDTEQNYATNSLELTRIQDEQQKYFLYAPATGKILKRFLDFASPVNPNTPIFMLKSSKHSWIVTALLTESEMNAVKIGDSAKVYFYALPQQTLLGTVQKIAYSLTEQSNMLEVEIALSESVPSLRAGMNAKVSIETRIQYRGYPVPLNAFIKITPQNQATLFVVDKEQKIARKRQVEFHLIKGINAVVSTDLSKFNELIIAGQHNLKEGSLIQILQE